MLAILPPFSIISLKVPLQWLSKTAKKIEN